MVSWAYGNASETVLTGGHFNPEEHTSFLERLANPITAESFTSIYNAYEQHSRVVEGFTAGTSAQSQAYDEVIDLVKQRTGQILYKPARYANNAAERARSLVSDTSDEDSFLNRLRDLKKQFPEQLSDFDPERVSTEGRRVAQRAESEYQKQSNRYDQNPLVTIAAGLAGGLWGSRQDPLRVASLFINPQGIGASALMRIGTAIASNFAVGFGTTLAAQPFESAWRETADLDPLTAGQAFKNAAFGGALNAAFAGGAQAISEGAKVYKGWRSHARADQLITQAEAQGKFIDEPAKLALRAADQSDVLDRQVVSAIELKGTPLHDISQSLEDASLHILDPEAPLPLGTIRTLQEAPPEAALAVLKTHADDVGAALDAFRLDPGAQVSALASDIPSVALLGHVSRLEDKAFAMVRGGEADIMAGALVARSSPHASEQVALLELIQRSGAQTPEAMRRVISDHINAATAPEAAAVRAGGDVRARGDGDATPKEPPALIQEVPPVTSAAVSGKSYLFDVRNLKIDAKTMQFKSEGDALGVTPILKGVQEWRPEAAGSLIVWQARNGDFYVADGHQRTGLARRLISDGRKDTIQIAGVLYREADGYSAEQIMRMAALKNLREGSGSLVDGAKILRSAPDEIKGLQQISRESTRQMTDLANLSDESFRMVINEVVPANYAAVVGGLVDDAARQKMALEVLAKAAPSSIQEAQIIVRRLKDIELRKSEASSQGALFDFNDATSTFFEENKIISKAVTELRRDKALFSRAVREADKLEEAGSLIERSASQRIADDASKLSFILEKNADKEGAIRTALLQAAREVKDGTKTLNAAAAEFTEAVRKSGVDVTGSKAYAPDDPYNKIPVKNGENISFHTRDQVLDAVSGEQTKLADLFAACKD